MKTRINEIVLLIVAMFCFSSETIQAQCDVDFEYYISSDTVYFQNLSSNIVVGDNFEWDLDNGSVFQLDSLFFSYNTQDIYNVCLTRTNLLTVPPCTETVCKDVIFCVDCVWPGDANSDLIADNKDVLYIGLAYGSTGPNRTIGTLTDWAPKISLTLWEDLNSIELNFVTGVNYKHADCDGNGVIDEDDLLPLDGNYNKTHNKSRPPACTGVNDVPLYFDILYDSIEVGSPVEISVRLGSNSLPANNAYGMAYTIHYDSRLVDTTTIEIEYSSTGFKINPNDTIIHLNKHYEAQGEYETAVSRTNQIGKTISGQEISTVSFVMEDNLVQKNGLITDYLTLYFSDVFLIDSDENQIPVCAFTDSVLIYQRVASIGNESIQNSVMKIHPNPVSSVLNIETSTENISSARVFSLSGEMVLSNTMLEKNSITQLDVSELTNGLYFIEVSTGASKTFRKFIKQ